jgi:membrane protein implicated in regulation of membrane protease activity
MTAAVVWLIVLAAFVIGEIYSRAFFALFVALAAGAAAITAAAGGPFALQAAMFVVVGLGGIAAARPPLKRAMTRGHYRLVSGAAGLVGKEGVVAWAVGDNTSPGKVRIQGELWPAVSDDGGVIEPGALVLVLELRGTRFVVHEIPRGSPPGIG